MQDTATQAMTEVALGLSMAFFALLILALISISLPNSENEADDQLATQIEYERSFELNTSDNEAQASSEHAESSKRSDKSRNIVFYWQQSWFDANMQPITVAAKYPAAETKTNGNIPLVVVVSKSTSFEELLTIQQELKAYSIELAEMTPEWQKAFIQAGR